MGKIVDIFKRIYDMSYWIERKKYQKQPPIKKLLLEFSQNSHENTCARASF